MSDELALRIEAFYTRALLTIADRDKLTESIEPLRARREQIDVRLDAVARDDAMQTLAERWRRIGLGTPIRHFERH